MAEETIAYLLTLSCANRPGIVARVSTELFERGADIIEAHQYDDRETSLFFTRIVFTLPASVALADVQEGFKPIAEDFAMQWRLRPFARRTKTVILASKADHCLMDLIYRWTIGELQMDIVAVVSNHPRETFKAIDFHAIPFHHLPVTPKTKSAQEQQIKAIVDETGAELVILARYMQILSDSLAAHLTGRCINIHHSFLPGFKGARPYHQAHERGVKIIGATAHYVTAELDEGPIIEQDVERISHSDSPAQLIRKGRDIERRVLARAVGLHLDGRVFLRRGKTIVFRD